MENISALVIGCGFGIHHARILSEIDTCKYKIPDISKVIISSTNINIASEKARMLSELSGCKRIVVGEQIKNKKDLQRVLSEYNPGYVSIAAKDPVIGDNIHHEYAQKISSNVIVLCEKPYCLPEKNINQIKEFLKSKSNIGLHLPMYVVQKKLNEIPEFKNRLDNAKDIEFVWTSTGSGKNDILLDLILHPWSFFPVTENINNIGIINYGNNASVSFEYLPDDKKARHTMCTITLKTSDSGFRAMRIDDYVIGFNGIGPGTEVIELEYSLKKSEKKKPDNPKVLLRVSNPLEEHIINALRKKPVCGRDIIYRSQMFLKYLNPTFIY